MPKMWAVLAAVIATIATLAGTAGAATNPGDSKNCTDFPTWNEAQVWFETYYAQYKDVAHLDANGDQVACEQLPHAPTSTPPARVSGGYLMAERSGTVFGFGDAGPLSPLVRSTIVSIASAPNGGYWLLGSDGTVHSRGAQHFGNATAPGVSSIAAKKDGTGYWVFTRTGAVQAFGAAKAYGDMSGTALNGEIIAAAVTPSGNGYWMVGSDGGIFTFGDAVFYGSTGNLKLNKPVVGIAPDPDGAGYWLVAADGGIFAFQATFRGSVPQQLKPGQSLNRPVIGAIAYGNGYLMVASDGGIFAFSNQPFFGSLGATPPVDPIVGVAARTS